MAPMGNKINSCNPPRLPSTGLHRTVSDISTTLNDIKETKQVLRPVSEVKNVKCECCGMCEECTPEYIQRVRDKYSGKWICGLCAEAVKEEMGKNGGKREEAMNSHMSVCERFNKFGRAYPVLYQAEAMRDLLRKTTRLDAGRGIVKPLSPRGKLGITRSSSCIPAISQGALWSSSGNY